MKRHTIFMDWKIQHNKMSVISKLIYRFDTILIKITTSLFVDTDMLILKYIWKGTGTRITKTILEKKNKVREITLSDLRLKT